MQDLTIIPAEMKALPNWVLHKNKVPYTPGTGQKAKVNDPGTWRTFAEAVQALQQEKTITGKRLYDGIGFMFTGSGLVGIDIDHCMAAGIISQDAAQVVETFNSYTEISTSRRGLHIIVKGSCPGKKSRKGNYEIYDHDRYFIMTGNAYKVEPIRADQEQINAFYTKHIAPPEENRTKPEQNAPAPEQTEAAENVLSLRKLASVIRKSKSGALFSRLFDNGDITGYKSQSEADQALMNLLPFYTGGDPEQMRQLFSMSALAIREKWQRKDYQDKTIQTALKSWDGTSYDPGAYRMCWPDVVENSRGQMVPLKFSKDNVEYLLQRLGIKVRFNTMTKTIDFIGQERLAFDAVAAAIKFEAHKRGYTIGRQDLNDLLGLIAELNPYNPVRDYLTQCRKEWDGREIYVDQLFNTLELNEDSNQDPEFCKKLLRVWLITAVRVAFNDGDYAAQGMLILEGKQGIGKTRFKYQLLPVKSWANDMTLDPTIKDHLLKAAHYWIAELGEFKDTMKYNRIDMLKQYITQARDAIRLPYARETVEFPRTTVFMGTVNGGSFLYDHTGNRRYWPISVKGLRLQKDFPKNQLWGQVMHLAFEKQENAWLTLEEIEKLNKQNEAFERKSIIEILIRDKLDWSAPVSKWRKVTATDLCVELGINRAQNGRVGRTLQGMATKDKRIQVPTNNVSHTYLLPAIKQSGFIYPEILPEEDS